MRLGHSLSVTKKDAAVGAVDDASRHDAALNWLNAAAAWAFALALLAAIVFMRGAWRKLGATFFGCALVLGWWLTLKPSNTAHGNPTWRKSRGLK